MTDMSLAEALAATEDANGDLIAPAPPNWMQGRTTYGGYSAALLLHAAQSLTPDPPPIRSALINFTGPISSAPTLTAKTLRAGRNVTTVSADATLDGAVAATGVFTFGGARASEIDASLPAPDAPPPDALEPLVPPQAAPFVPRFLQNFDMRLIDGHRPYSGASEGYLRCWGRHKDEASREGPVSLFCFADGLPPAVFATLNKRTTNSSMTWICNFLSDDLATEDGWWQTETRMTAAKGGYSSQVMRIWNSRGDLVVEGMQSVIIFG